MDYPFFNPFLFCWSNLFLFIIWSKSIHFLLHSIFTNSLNSFWFFKNVCFISIHNMLFPIYIPSHSLYFLFCNTAPFFSGRRLTILHILLFLSENFWSSNSQKKPSVFNLRHEILAFKWRISNLMYKVMVGLD